MLARIRSLARSLACSHLVRSLARTTASHARIISLAAFAGARPTPPILVDAAWTLRSPVHARPPRGVFGLLRPTASASLSLRLRTVACTAAPRPTPPTLVDAAWTLRLPSVSALASLPLRLLSLAHSRRRGSSVPDRGQEPCDSRRASGYARVRLVGREGQAGSHRPPPISTDGTPLDGSRGTFGRRHQLIALTSVSPLSVCRCCQYIAVSGPLPCFRHLYIVATSVWSACGAMACVCRPWSACVTHGPRLTYGRHGSRMVRVRRVCHG